MNHHNTGAELQTLRESARISRDTLANACGVETRTIKHWETRKGAGVPADVWQTMVDLFVFIKGETGKTMALAIKDPGESILFLRYRNTKDMPTKGMAADVHGAIVSGAFMELIAIGEAPRIVWFNPDSYAQWLSTQDQGQPEAALHSAWAARHGLAEQAKPHRGDQPEQINDIKEPVRKGLYKN